MNDYLLRTFGAPSRFTFPERHVSAMKAVAMNLPPRLQFSALDVGPGVFEPFVLGSIIEKWSGIRVSCLDAVEQDLLVFDMLTDLLGAHAVRIEDIAAVSTNFDDTGSSHPNNDIITKERLDEGIKILEAAGIPASRWFRQDYRLFLPQVSFEVNAWQMDIQRFVSSPHMHKYDFVFFGAVLVNLRKTSNHKDIMNLLVRLHNDLSQDAILGLTTVPREFLEVSGTFQWLQESGFRLLCVFPERIVMLPGEGVPQIHGDIAAIFQRIADPVRSESRTFCETLLSSVARQAIFRPTESPSWERTSDEWWHSGWLPVGWASFPEPGYQFLLDLRSMKPGERFLFDPMVKEIV